MLYFNTHVPSLQRQLVHDNLPQKDSILRTRCSAAQHQLVDHCIQKVTVHRNSMGEVVEEHKRKEEEEERRRDEGEEEECRQTLFERE